MRFGFVTPWLVVRVRLPRWSMRFSLGTVLALVAAAAVFFAWVRDRRRLESELSLAQGELLRLNRGQSSWGVEQLLGPPDTAGTGDLRTAWASATQDGQPEWLVLDYDAAVVPTEIVVCETYNPGAVVKASIFDPLGREVVVWQGKDPTAATAAGGESRLPVSTVWKTSRVKLYLDSPNVPGWNEIDAVGLVDGTGRTQWARNADASSAFGGMRSQGAAAGGFIGVPRPPASGSIPVGPGMDWAVSPEN